MNTWIWGPPTWKFLHTLSFSPRVQLHPNADRAAKLLILLQYVLPCSFCRDSYTQYFGALQRQFSNQSLRDIIAHGQLAEWMYALHQMVNNKLNHQILTREVASGNLARADPEYVTRLLQERQISFECLVKRFRVRPVAFSDSDVWDMLKMFAFNLDSMNPPPSASPSASRELFNNAWVSFLDVMPHAVEVAGGSRSLVSALVHVAQLTAQLRARRRVGEVEAGEKAEATGALLLPASTDTFLHCVVAGFKKQLQEHEHRSCHCTGSNNGESSVSTTLQRNIYEVARAKVCKDGSCK